MTRILYPAFLSLALLLPVGPVEAQTDKELRDRRQASEKARRDEQRSRDQMNAEATRTFSEYARGLEAEYKEKLRELDTGFELRQVALKADQDAKIAGAEAETQKKLSALLMRSDAQWTPERLKAIEQQARAHSDELFRIRKEAAAISHKEKMAVASKKHALLEEMDEKAMARAASLGLTKDYPPILAAPTGGALTKQEEQWNQREEQNVARLRERNARTLSKFQNGAKLRAWERENQDEDFRLAWEERRELHELESRQSLFSALVLQAGEAKEADRQSLIDRIAELNKEQQLIRIKYERIRSENAIKRREERRKIVGG